MSKQPFDLLFFKVLGSDAVCTSLFDLNPGLGVVCCREDIAHDDAVWSCGRRERCHGDCRILCERPVAAADGSGLALRGV